ncbi:sulfatase-like hydrolase/transferase [Halococcus hamelinensis]|uniref:Sulfatase n=1 Tax=Halococcus hamelinensis 100A6 TaxID=1132509 RepID=M0LXS2_9EURY|nr:sulfatase [Halococcus hamelinensis]EMA37963.1 sulfatase [Halococcus hamelinensis 100A6]
MPDTPNLLLLCVDCLRGDAVDDGWGETPFLDSFVAGGRSYANCFASATTTTPCVASMMTGRYAEGNGVRSLREARLAPGVSTLAERLSVAGYDTAAFVTGPLVAETDLDRGFDTYRYRENTESLFDGWEPTELDSLFATEKPSFCYLHLWELHEPITVPAEFRGRENGRWPYERALSALDPSLERLLESVPEDTVVALCGDHGESITWRHNPLRRVAKRARDKARYEFGVDTRGMERRLDRLAEALAPASIHDHFVENGHGETVFDHVANVPLVLSGPGIEPGRETAVCRQVDLYPTLLDALGLDGSEDVDGESLLDPANEELDDREAYIRACGAALRGKENWVRALRTSTGKYVEYPNRDWGPEYYDLAADPAERAPVDDPDPDRLRALARRLPESEGVETERLAIDERLRALGYR